MGHLIQWVSETPDLVTAPVIDEHDHAALYLVVESLPGGGWDWAAWSNRQRLRSYNGLATTRDEAMAAAVRAALSECATDRRAA